MGMSIQDLEKLVRGVFSSKKDNQQQQNKKRKYLIMNRNERKQLEQLQKEQSQ